MDLQEPQHSPSPDTDKSDTETLRSATPSQNNTLGSFKPLPETEALFLPEWGRSQEAVSWFLKLRKVLKGIIYRYCGALQKALLIFELNDATDSVHYTLLTQFLQKVWVRWKEFNDRKIITTTFLSSSVICDDLSKPVAWMRRMASPRNAAPWCAKEMTQLIHTVRQAATELFWNRGLIEDAKARLVEANDGHHVSLFCDLPAPDPDDHESLPSEDEDTDSGEMVLYSREMKDPKLLLENGLEPIWVEGYGYPGPVPQEIDDHLGSNGGRKYNLQCLGFTL
jgi:hypothetical protein